MIDKLKVIITALLCLLNIQNSSGIACDYTTAYFNKKCRKTTNPTLSLRNVSRKFLHDTNTFQHKRKYVLNHLSVSLTNSVNSFPITGYPAVFYSQFHPGFTIGTGFKWKEGKKTDLTQTLKAGCFFHRYIQHAAMIYTETGVRRKVGDWGISAMLGLGYLHSFPATQRFQLNTGTGEYEKIRNWGRPQGMFGFTLGLDRKINEKLRGFVRFQTIIQTPFVSGYIPVLPVNQLHAGITMPWPFGRKEKAQ